MDVEQQGELPYPSKVRVALLLFPAHQIPRELQPFRGQATVQRADPGAHIHGMTLLGRAHGPGDKTGRKEPQLIEEFVSALGRGEALQEPMGRVGTAWQNQAPAE